MTRLSRDKGLRAERAIVPTHADALLAARQTTHGDFAETAAVAQAIKAAFGDRAARLSPVQREALDQIATKLARILCGDPRHADHWRDIAAAVADGQDRGKPEIILSDPRQLTQ